MPELKTLGLFAVTAVAEIPSHVGAGLPAMGVANGAMHCG